MEPYYAAFLPRADDRPSVDGDLPLDLPDSNSVNHPRDFMRGRRTLAAAVACVALMAPSAVRAQQAAVGEPQFAPGILTTIPPTVDRADAISLHDIVEITSNPKLKWTPSKWFMSEAATPAPTNRTLYEMAHNAAFVQDVWCLELAFKPLRIIEVDVPLPTGRAQRKQIWYIVYRVRNTGAGLTAEVKPDGSFVTAEEGTEPVRFLPEFVLASQDRTDAGQPLGKAYLDRMIPAAIEPIRRRELSQGRLLTSVEMARQDLRVETGRVQRGEWGVAMWEDLDPQIDFFSIYVGGLTNAFRWDDPAGAYKLGDPPGAGRLFTRKKLQLNFWRPGDEIEEDEREVRYGAAPGRGDLYGSGEGVAYQWVYR